MGMSSRLILRQTSEDRELQKKLAELVAVETELVQRELDLTTLRGQLHGFERDYLQIIGSRYQELERIEAQISEYMRYLESCKNFKPSDNLKKLYREVAKRIHPDLVTDEAEKRRRQELMAQVNRAYEEQDEEKLQAILQEWENRPESVKGNGIVAELIGVIRKIAQGRERLKAIEAEIETLEQTDLYQLQDRVIVARKDGRDLLAEMAHHLDQKIAEAHQRLNELKEQLG